MAYIQVACCHSQTGKGVVSVPVQLRALVERHAQYGEGYVEAFGTDRFHANGWFSDTPFNAWLQLPGVFVEKA